MTPEKRTISCMDDKANRRAFVLDTEAWEAFEAALDRPAHDVPGLRDLLTTPTVLNSDA